MWETITAPQATVVSGILTLIAAVLGVVIGWWLFSGRVKDLKSAIDASDKLLLEHRLALGTAIDEIKGKVSGLDAQFTTALESLGQLRGNVSDLQITAAIDDRTVLPAEAVTRETLRDDWDKIRDTIEQIAADPRKDGRTRAKYARIDRRQYMSLIDALANDGALGNQQQAYRDAASLWLKYRNGRQTPSAVDVNRMAEIRKAIKID